jgi:hypothetical protein
MSTVVVSASSYNATLADDTILCDTSSNSVTINLPATHPLGKRYVIKHTTGGNAVIVQAIDIDTIDSLASFTFTVNKQAIITHSDGSNWFIL